MNNDISALVQASLQAQIIQAFKDAPEAIDALVKASIEQEVTEYGGKPDYNSRTKMPYLTWLVGEQIRSVARESVTEVIEARRSEIKSAVAKAMSADNLVDGLTETLLGSLKEDWRVTIKFSGDRDR